MAGPFKMKGIDFGNSPLHKDKVTKISDARAACKKKGGVWNSKTHTCEMPETVTKLSGKKVELKSLEKKIPGYWD